MSAATAGMIAFMSSYDSVTLSQLMAVLVPTFFLAAIVTSLSVFKRGKELEDDPEFRRRVAAGEYETLHAKQEDNYVPSPGAKKGVAIFGLAVLSILVLGSFTSLLPTWDDERLPTPALIQMVMLTAALFIMLLSKAPSSSLNQGSVFRAGLMGVVAILGVSWMTATLFETYQEEMMEAFGHVVSGNPMVFGVVVFVFSLIIMSPAATTAAVMPLGMTLGIPAPVLIALMPLTSSDFIIPGANQIGCVALDRTGTTKIGRFVVNHSYIRPGFVMILSQVLLAYLMTLIVF